MNTHRVTVTSTLLVLVAAAGSHADTQISPNGFLVRHETRVNVAPTRVYGALVEEVAQWWHPGHTLSGDAGNLTIDARPGGCFCETLPDGGGVEHLRVVSVMPGELLRMSGALGPLQASGLAGSMTWKLTAAAGGTRIAAGGTTIELSYRVGGFMEGGFEPIAPAVETVLGEQLQRLALYVETGEPTRAAGH